MGNTIATNVSSLNAQRQLTGTNNALQTTFQRLSSGFRINSAKDDAAGLQISNRLTSQISGLGVAARNANDGISLAQTAEGALQESTNILQRMRDLAIQSANGSNGSSERAALQQEVAQLQAELNRIADTTRFGSRTLLDGSFGTQTFQVGAQAFETITVATGNARANAVGSYQINFDSVATNAIGGTIAATGANVKVNTGAAITANALAGTTLTVSGSLGKSTVTYAAGATAKSIASSVNAVTKDTGVSASARTNVKISTLTAVGNLSFTLASENTTGISISASLTSTSDLSALAEAVNRETAQTGVYATVSDDKASIILTNESGADIGITNLTHSDATKGVSFTLVDFDGGFNTESEVGAATALVGDGANDAFAVGLLQFNSQRSYTVTAAAATDYFSVTTAVGGGLNAVSAVDISSANGAQNAIAILDNALQAVDSIRGDLGAVQNRFQSTISNLNNVAENASAARSRIRDTDYAAETAQLAKNQVLQQAGLAVLAQANASSQSVLSLLQ
ncbi:flagellin [Permianibacter aggregans]|uniref:Flagellin n=1 Tax=Permianibacter aggregans TaxID=1510150 RepID=A0A4V3D7N2_9GAMM|nr:flagellin [Permianibacter aggregans]QGX38289.1 flagellin [Permianibacter aggregans]TDQ48607.1 flagellin [Permianibacter aggregans]